MTTRGEQTDAYLEIKAEDGGVSQFPLTCKRLVIGRAEDSQLHLNHSTVSRHHAELYCDPFGRWWVRDLGSRNGIRVNGVQVTESVFQPGDKLTITVYSISLRTASDVLRQTVEIPASSLNVSDESPLTTTAIDEMEPPKIAASHLDRLTEFSQQLVDTEDGGERLRLLCSWMLCEAFRGRGAIALRLLNDRPDEPPQALCETQFSSESSEGEFYISRSVLQRIRETGKAMLATNVGSGEPDMRISLSPDVMLMAAVACPLHRDDKITDILYVTFPPECGTGEWLALVCLAVKQYQQAESVCAGRERAKVQAVIEQELERARELQLSLVPRKFEVEGLDVEISFEPCRWVGGDYVDILAAPEGRTLLVVADVCGKGLQAALVSAGLHTMVHTSLRSGLGIVEMMKGLNEELCDMLPEQSFVTMVSVLVNPKTGEAECINAGHPPPIVISPEGEVRHLQSAANLPLGIVPQELECERCRMSPGHLLALYTDGLSELTDESGKMLGIDGLATRIKSIYCSTEGGWVSRVSEALNAFIRETQGARLPDDDQTLLLARCRES